MYKRRMDDPQYLYPEAIYQLSRVLQEIWDASIYRNSTTKRTNKPLVITSIFSKHSRTFHWASVASNRWTIGEALTVHSILKAIRPKTKAWNEYDEAMRSLESPTVNEALKCLLERNAEPGAERITYHRALLHLFESYPVHPRFYVDGIIYRGLAGLHEQDHSGNRLISYSEGSLLRKKKKTYRRYAWVDMKAWGRNDGQEFIDLNLQRYQCQEAEKAAKNTAGIKKPRYQDPHMRKGWTVHTRLLDELFLKTERGEAGKGTGRDFFITVPIYDVWLEGQPWGNLCGNVLLLFKYKNERKTFKKDKLPALLANSRLFPEDLGRSALSIILGQPLWDKDEHRSYDLVEHFVRQIVWLQDWKRIIVYRKKGEATYEPQYCYQRVPNSDGIRMDWKRCPHKEGNNEKEFPDCQTKKWDDQDGNLHWAQDLWDKAFLPDLSDEERGMYGDIRLACEYPLSAVIPSNPQLRKALDDHYIRQQIEVLRGLAPKVRARRSALRTAAVAILGRGMSHNLGSHVLADLSHADRIATLFAYNGPHLNPLNHWSKRACALGEPECKLAATLVGNLNQYLRQRMDLIAELATTQPGWAIPFDLKLLIADFHNQWLLRDNLVRSHGIAACNQDPDGRVYTRLLISSDCLVNADIPHGMIGVQAFYMFLENFIRNTAKHGDILPSDELKIHVACEKDGNDYYKVTIRDNVLICDRRRTEVSDRIKQAMIQPLCNGQDQLIRKNWGFQEMKIGAAFLRMRPPDAVEQKADRGDWLEPNTDILLSEGRVEYSIRLLQAKWLVVVDPVLANDISKDQLGPLGIDVVASLDAVPKMSATGVRHRLMVVAWPVDTVERDGWLKTFDKIQQSLPYRILWVNGPRKNPPDGYPHIPSDDYKAVAAKLSSASPESAIGTVYEWWIRAGLLNENTSTELDTKVALIISDGEAKNHSNGTPPWVRVLPDDFGIHPPEEPLSCWRSKLDLQWHVAVIYDRHAREANGGLLRGGDASNQKLGEIVEAPLIPFYEPYEQPSPIHSVTVSAWKAYDAQEAKRHVLACQLLEAGLVSIIVADERASDWVGSLKQVENGRKLLELEGMGITVIQFNETKDPKLEEVQEAITSVGKNQKSRSFTFLTVHQGVLDHLAKIGKQAQTETDYINGFVNEWRDKGVSVVIHSGRGKPDQVRHIKGVRFLEYSNLVRYLMEGTSKFHLVNLLFSLRETGR